jgi:hypothetical protein
VRIGQRHAKGGAEGVGAGVIDRAVAGDDRYRAIGEIAKETRRSLSISLLVPSRTITLIHPLSLVSGITQ